MSHRTVCWVLLVSLVGLLPTTAGAAVDQALLDALQSQDEQTRSQAVFACWKRVGNFDGFPLPHHIVCHLARSFHSYPPKDRQLAVRSVQRSILDLKKPLPKDCVASLEKGMSDPNEPVWQASVQTLALLDRPKYERLLEHLLSGKPMIRARVASYFGEQARAGRVHPQSLPLLLKLLATSKDVEVRRQASRTLADMATRVKRPPDFIPTLVKGLEDSDDKVAVYCVAGLGSLEEPAYEAVLPLLESDSQKARANAANVLGLIGAFGYRNPKAIPHLEKLMKSEDPKVKRYAAYALQWHSKK